MRKYCFKQSGWSFTKKMFYNQPIRLLLLMVFLDHSEKNTRANGLEIELYLLHCQSFALNRPLLFSANFAPISCPDFLTIWLAFFMAEK